MRDCPRHSLARSSRRPFDDMDIPIGCALDRRSVKSYELTAPPQTLRPLLGHRGEPILPEHSAHFAWWLTRERIALEKAKNVVVVGKQPHFGLGHNRIVPP